MTIGSLRAQDFSTQLMDQYSEFKESTLSHRRFKHKDLVPLIEQLPARGFRVQEAGKSYQGRNIYLISIGSGPITVLLWSQMHGNEATATMAMFDIFNFLGRPDSEAVKKLLSGMTLYFIPMLNPDGAELFQRRTAQGIDMNRDALALTCPESAILKSVRDSIQAQWGFNLHDQNIYYNVGSTEKTATISFLAPAYNQEKDTNPGRADAMKVIAVMNESLQLLIPGQVGKYDDTFEPRAFGDNMQKWGTSTILIESGAFAGDPEKQFIRQLNFMTILTALSSIERAGFTKYKLQSYWDIPLNNSNLNDVIIRKVQVGLSPGPPFLVDIAIRREEFDVGGDDPVYYRGTIEDLGDLSTQYGYQEINAEGLDYAPALVYPEVLAHPGSLGEQMVRELLQQGYGYVIRQQHTDQQHIYPPNPRYISGRGSTDDAPGQRNTNFPFDVVDAGFVPPAGPKVEKPATFLLKKDGKIKYVVINGFVHEIDGKPNDSANGWIY